jgi:hypothetical protein
LAPTVEPSPSVMESPRVTTAPTFDRAATCTASRKNQDSSAVGYWSAVRSPVWLPAVET